jgi:hypothetical protein
LLAQGLLVPKLPEPARCAAEAVVEAVVAVAWVCRFRAAATGPFSAARFLSLAPAAGWSVQPGASVGQAAALPLVELAERHAVEVVAAAAAHAVARQRVARDAGAEAAAVLPDVVEVVAAAARAVAAEVEAEVASGPGAPAVPLSGPLSAWVFHRDQALPWPAPRPSARTAHAMEQWPVAWP